MGKYSDMILLGGVASQDPVQQKPQPKKSYSNAILGVPKIERDYTPTDEIDTRTAKPKVEWTPTGKSGASFGASIKSGFVDDPLTKMKIYAKSRGIPLDRYRIVEGEIVYQDDDGKWYPEKKELGPGALKQLAGEMIPHAPAAVMSAMGAASPAPLALAPLGAAGGEGIRKTIGALAFDEPQTTKGNIADMAVEAGTALAFERAGQAIKGAANMGGRRLGGNVASQAGEDFKYIDLESMGKMKRLGEDIGVDLLPPQTTGSKRLADKFNLLGDLDSSSPTIQAARKKQQKEIQGAADRFFNDISTPGADDYQSGKNLVKAADKGISDLKKVRSDLAKPYYDKAKNVRGVDISGTIKKLDDVIKDTPEASSERMAISRIKKMLTTGVEDSKGNKFRVPQDKISVLDKVKKEINSKWKKDPAKAPDKDTQKSLNSVLKDMLKSIDEQVPEYAKARKVYETASPYVDQYKKSIVGDVARLEGDNVVKASQRLFSSVGSSPETVAKARRLIHKKDPDAWNAALKSHLRGIFEKQKSSAGGVDATTNIGGMFFKRTYGDPTKRKVLKAAMSKEQYEYFEKLSKVFERAGMILRKESATATRQEMLRDIAGKKTTRMIEIKTRPMVTKWRAIGDWYNKFRLGKNAKDLADALTTTRGHIQLNRAYQLGPKSEKFIPALSVFLGMIGTGALKSAHKKVSLPETRTKQSH